MNEKQIREKLLNDLDKHSIEELILINSNCENYSNYILNNINMKNSELLSELEKKQCKLYINLIR